MIGKIVINQIESIIYTPVTKTSKSGYFNNSRLALLSIPDAVVGYLSKVPQPLYGYQDSNCMNHCKQKINLRQNPNFTYKIDPKDPTTVLMSWLQNEQKEWQFKFKDPFTAQEWMRYIALSLYQQKPKTQEKQIDFSKLHSPKSRFVQPQPNSNHSAQIITIKEQNQRRQNRFPHETIAQVEQFGQIDHSNRFQRFQKQNRLAQPEDAETLPIITTFRQKFNNHAAFNNIGHEQKPYQPSKNSWNLKWLDEIQTKEEAVTIEIYNEFVKFCQHTSTAIISEITSPKADRKFVPIKITPDQEIYTIDQVTFKLCTSILSSNFNTAEIGQKTISEQYQQQFQNNRFILTATHNKNQIKVPPTCIIKYLGFTFFCQANPPPHYKEVEKGSLHLFQKPISKLQQKIKLRIDKNNLSLFTNRPYGPSDKPTKSSFIIAYNLYHLLPAVSLANSTKIFAITPQFMLLSADQYFMQEGNIKKQKQIQKCMGNFLRAQQSKNCSIISVEDLQINLKRHLLDRTLLSQLFSRCNSKYLRQILLSEIVAENITLLIESIMAKYIHYQLNKTISLTEMQAELLLIFSQIWEQNSNHWKFITQWIFERYHITVKNTDIKIGYIFYSISRKIGLQLNYQILMNQHQLYFNQKQVIPQQSIKRYYHNIIQFMAQDLSRNYNQINLPLQHGNNSIEFYQDVVQFYCLQSSLPNLGGYLWRCICKLLSLYVPYNADSQFQHLHIYSWIPSSHLDFPLFSKIKSIIKWQLLQKKVTDALQTVNLFRSIGWFWTGEDSPFIAQIWQMLSRYYQQLGQPTEAVFYMNEAVAVNRNIYPNSGERQNLDNNYKLAQLLLLNHLHKESLQKFKMVKKTMEKCFPENIFLLDIMIVMARLYLHLGSVQKCLLYSKEALKFSTFATFKSEEQEFEVYQLILKSLQIQDQTHKYKFYVDIVQDKFSNTSSSWILREVLKLTISQLALSLQPLQLKKVIFFMYCTQKTESLQQKESISQDIQDLFCRIKNLIVNEKPSQVLRNLIQNCTEITDDFMMVKESSPTSDPKKGQIFKQQAITLQILCEFIGYQFILGQIVDRLKQKTLN